MNRILIAGIGNVFNGDDAFGCEVARQLKHCNFPEGVTVVDFGIRTYDLVYALTDGYDAVILVDAIPNKARPGTVYLVEPDVNNLDELDRAAMDSHSINPVAALQMAQRAGDLNTKLYLVGCEPSVLEDYDSSMGLSETAREAVPYAVEMIRSLVDELLSQEYHEAGSPA